jgi:hypothetical protein
LPALLAGGLLIGCGASSSSRTSPAATRPAASVATTQTTAAHHAFAQAEGPALAACRHAVAQEATVAAGAKPEISALCDRVNDVIEDNESTVRAVCTELAGSSSAPDASARKRVYSRCYAEYAKTIK